MKRCGNFAGKPVDRPSKPNAYCHNVSRKLLPYCFLNCFPNARTPIFLSNKEPVAGNNPAFPVATNNLQLCSADLDSQVYFQFVRLYVYKESSLCMVIYLKKKKNQFVHCYLTAALRN
jgi:hypothetical protein